MVKVAVVGATGYAGEELLKILANHKKAEVTSVSAKIDQPQKISAIFPYLSGKIDLLCSEPDFDKIVCGCDLAFLALPHRVSMQIAPLFLKAEKKVIDLSADYRLKDKNTYEKWYGIQHSSPNYLDQSVYGLPEVYKDRIKEATLIANPGCFPTGVILGCLPLLVKHIADNQSIIADSKTGLSGAGREKEAVLIPKLKDNFMAYKINMHQHAPEIDQELTEISGKETVIIFVPHLIPIQRGILSTIYIRLNEQMGEQEIHKIYQQYYMDKPFVKILPLGESPQLKDVTQGNYCHIGLKLDQKKNMAIIVTAIDNLVKGASGQAVQNMNIMYGFEETEGLL
ncbi:MAG: N-acetyl-gamma-glutamyl-phosphate reductase [Candidatus Omnitrophica bacterium]|nr:N-acetyl-gamma-glutamyl-phosphate reductase [Candidatus Omnitrophota bacterium]